MHARTCAHLLDEAHAAQVHVVGRAGIEHLLAVDGARPDEGVVHQLRRAPDKGQELIIVQSPHPVRACRLKPETKSSA